VSCIFIEIFSKTLKTFVGRIISIVSIDCFKDLETLLIILQDIGIVEIGLVFGVVRH
jgi:hypothetical protein